MNIDSGSAAGQGVRDLSNPDARRFGALPTATGAVVRQACARLADAGIAIEPLLQKTGLTLRQIEDARARITVRSQISFLNLAAAALGDDLLGFHLAQSTDPREVGLLFYVMASSETLTGALQNAARYSSIVNDGISIRYADAGIIRMAFSYVGVSRHHDRHQIEFWMTLAVRACRRLTGLDVTPTRVRLVHRREQACPELLEFFANNVEFGAAVDDITFAAGIRDMPVVGADHYLNKLLIAYCEEAVSRKPKTRGSLRASVENALVPLLPHGKARADEIARRLGLSQRTLTRQLSSEGLTFSDLLEGLRSDLAKHYLGDADLSISEIAWLLGYQEVSAFSHAFKRWTGATPRAARAGVAA